MDPAQPGIDTTERQRPLAQTAILVIGDILAFVLFAWLGRRTHTEAVGLDALAQMLETAAPFIAGWFLVSPIAGAFRAGITPAQMVGRTAIAWLLAWPVALLLRALALQRGIPLSFALVTGATNLILLVGWRTVYAWLQRR